MAVTAFLSRSPRLLNRGPGGPASLGHVPHSSIFSPTATAQSGVLRAPSAGYWFSLPHLISNSWTSFRRGYIIIWRPLFFLRASQFRTQFNLSTVKVISWYSSTGCTCYLHRCISYFDSLAGVNMLQKYKRLRRINYSAQSTRILESLQRGKKPPTSVLDKIVNYLIVTPQSWSFGGCGVPPHYNYFSLHSDLDWH